MVYVPAEKSDYSVTPVHLGIIFLANMQIGYFTPPMGMNLFIAGYWLNKSIMNIYTATIPFMLVLLLTFENNCISLKKCVYSKKTKLPAQARLDLATNKVNGIFCV